MCFVYQEHEFQEKKAHEKSKEEANLRSILASAAEKRMKSTVPSSSKAASSTHQLSPDLFEDEDTDNRAKMDKQKVRLEDECYTVNIKI